jgi:hypothetical protein
MIINTMLAGHIVTASVERTSTDEHGTIYTCRFMYHTQTGSKRLCLDYGQNWNASEGYEFTCRQMQIDRATEHLKTALPGDGLGDWLKGIKIPA